MSKALSCHRVIMDPEGVAAFLNQSGFSINHTQQYREITHNAIEAILRTGRGGTVMWGSVETEWGLKLCCTDDGDGMSPRKMEGYLRKLAVNGESRNQRLQGNYGMGARLAGLYYNQFGLWYESWVRHDGTGVILHFDGEAYCFKTTAPERDAHFLTTLDTPDIIQATGSGTRVILLGNSEEEETLKGPHYNEAKRPPAFWQIRYLNTRYFRFPDGIKVLVQEYEPNGNGQNRVVTGQEPVLKRSCIKSGIVSLRETNAEAYWWIMREEDASPQEGGLSTRTGTRAHNVGGHVAYLYQDELYDICNRSNGGYYRLQQCGVVQGCSRVVIYIRPLSSRATTDVGRQHLVVDGQKPHWEEYAQELKENLPPELCQFIEDQSSKDRGERLDHTEELFKNAVLFPITGLIADDEGKFLGKEVPQPPRDRPSGGGGGNGKGRGSSSDTKRPRRKILEPSTDGKGIPAREVDSLRGPQVYWKPYTELDAEIKHRAAQYVEETHELNINQNFPGLTGWVDYVTKMYGNGPGIRTIVEDCIKDVWQYTLSELVLVYHIHKESLKDWSDAISPEGLTIGVMGRRGLLREIRASVTQRLGREPNRSTAPSAIQIHPLEVPAQPEACDQSSLGSD
jgi:hypothetical protein